jgi:hypothetical protein
MKRWLVRLFLAALTLTTGWRPASALELRRTSAPDVAQVATTATPGPTLSPAGDVPVPAAPAPAAPANQAPVAPGDEGDANGSKPWWRLVFIIPVALAAGGGAMVARQRARERRWIET